MDFLKLTKIVVTCSTVFFALNAHSASTKLTLATFNMKWFGLGGTMSGTPEQETRDVPLKKFIAENILPADVIVFEEVVDVPRLRKLLPKGWSCQSYENPTSNHQHVVDCVSEKYKLQLVDYDTNNLIETVAINGDRSRPAVRLNVATLQGKVLLTLVGVHLKAYPYESETRQFQAAEIGKDLAHSTAGTPIVVVGDFNTYTTANNGQASDDVQLIQKALNQMGGKFKAVPQVEKFSFRSGSQRGLFDHFFLSGNIKAVGAPDIFDVCSATTAGQGLMNIAYYNKNISDHCPVKVTVTFTSGGASESQ